MIHMDHKKIRSSLKRTGKSFAQTMPILFGVLLLVSMVLVLVPTSFYGKVFTGNEVMDPLIGAALGSIAAGNPITSYIIGGELIEEGVSLLAVVAFIVAWASVGLIHIPAEGLILGRRFALVRNGVCFLSAIAIAIIVSLVVELV